MLYLSELLIQNPDLDSFKDMLEIVKQRAQGEIHLKIDIKPNYVDTPANWEDLIEGAFSGVYSMFDAPKINTEDDL